MTMEITREAIEEGKDHLSIQSRRLIDLYKLDDIEFWNDEAVQACVNKLIELETKRTIWDYLKLLKK